MKLSLIAAVARNGVIGHDNRLLWQLPEDLKRFRATTMGAPVIMGRRTWDSLPAKFRPLPGRRNVVITRDEDWHADGAERAGSLDAAIGMLADMPVAYVIGGAEIYALALPRADELLMTEIDRDFEGDTRFPPWDRSRFEQVSYEPMRVAAPDGFDYAFVTYRRLNDEVPPTAARDAS